MKIYHRVFATVDIHKEKVLRTMGMDLYRIPRVHEEVGSAKFYFDIAETDIEWVRVQEIAQEWDLRISVGGPRFSQQDLDEAPYLEISAREKGYPQPEKDFQYLKASYDLSQYCDQCGTGAVQSAPFRFKGEPKWGRNSIMTLNWVHDELFVTPELWETVFKPFGVGCGVVLKHKTGDKLKTVVQLVTDEVTAPPLKGIERFSSETCTKCDRKKYILQIKDYWPPFDGPMEDHVCRTKEWFGSGFSAMRPIIVKKDIYDALKEHKAKGIAWHPTKKLSSE